MPPLADMYQQHIDAIRHAIPRAPLAMDGWQCDKEFNPVTGEVPQLRRAIGIRQGFAREQWLAVRGCGNRRDACAGRSSA